MNGIHETEEERRRRKSKSREDGNHRESSKKKKKRSSSRNHDGSGRRRRSDNGEHGRRSEDIHRRRSEDDGHARRSESEQRRRRDGDHHRSSSSKPKKRKSGRSKESHRSSRRESSGEPSVPVQEQSFIPGGELAVDLTNSKPPPDQRWQEDPKMSGVSQSGQSRTGSDQFVRPGATLAQRDSQNGKDRPPFTDRNQTFKPGAVRSSGGSQMGKQGPSYASTSDLQISETAPGSGGAETGSYRASYSTGNEAQRPGAVGMSAGTQMGKQRPSYADHDEYGRSQTGSELPNYANSGVEHRPGAVSVSGGSQSGKRRPSYNSSEEHRPGALSVSGGSQSGKRRPSYNSSEEHRPGAISISGGSQSGKQRPTYTTREEHRPGAMSVSGGSQSGKQRPTYTASEEHRPGAMSVSGGSQSGKQRPTYTTSQEHRPGAMPVSGGSQSGKQRPTYTTSQEHGPGAMTVSGGSQSGKQRPIYATSSERQIPGSLPRSGSAEGPRTESWTGQRPGAVAVANPPPSGKQRRSSGEVGVGAVSVNSLAPRVKGGGLSLAPASDDYHNSQRVGALLVSNPVSRSKSGLSSDSGDMVRNSRNVEEGNPQAYRRGSQGSSAGAVSIGSAAPRGKGAGRSIPSNRFPPTEDRFSSGTASVSSQIGAYSVASAASNGKRGGPSVSAGAESYDNTSYDDDSITSLDDSLRLDSLVNPSGRTHATSRVNDSIGASMSNSEKDRVSHFPASELYNSLSSLQHGTNTERKGRISQFPGEDFYEEDIVDEAPSKKKKFQRVSTISVHDGLEKNIEAGPAYSLSGDSYGREDRHENNFSQRSHTSFSQRSHGSTTFTSIDPSTRSSASHHSEQRRRRSSGAYFISGEGENANVEPREPGNLTDGSLSNDLNVSNVEYEEAHMTAAVTLSHSFVQSERAPLGVSSDDLKATPWYCSRTFWILLVLLVIIGGAVGVALPLVVFKDKDASSPTGTSGQPIDLDRQNAIRSVVLRVTDPNTLDDPSSPQKAAFDWIVAVDVLSPVTTGRTVKEEIEKVMSRYTLAVFYYSTNGTRWVSSRGWMDGYADECAWEFLSCVNQKVSEIDSGSKETGNNMIGVIPSEMKSLTALIDLVLPSNKLSPHPDLRYIPSLFTLDLNNNEIEGTFPDFIFQLTTLRILDLGRNKLTGTLSSGLSRLTSLDQLLLPLNKLSGTLTNELSGMKSIRVLDLAVNRLGGDLHTVIEGLSSLIFIVLDENRFSGRLDGQKLLSFPALGELALGINELEGTIPSELGSLTQLGSLLLDNNKLTGTIPPGLSTVAPLHALLLDNNQLTGSVPTELCSIRSLKEIRVDCKVTCECEKCLQCS